MQRASLTYRLTGVGLVMILAGAILILRHFHPSVPLTAVDLTKSKGLARAAVQIIEFSDFECPACRAAQQALSELTRLYPEKVRIIFQHFPLEGHRWSPLAHQAAECAAEQNRFWPYHDRLYAEQATWSVAGTNPLENFLRYAKEAGMDLDRFSLCLGEGHYAQQRIRQEKATGVGLGVRSTPSFFVNGKMVVGFQTLKQEVEKALQ